MPSGDPGLALITKAVGGDEIALQQLLLSYTSRLSQHIGSRFPQSIQGVLSVDDIMQQTFIEVFRDIRRFEPRSEAAFWAWLKSIAEHRIQDAIKAQSRKKRGGDRRQIRPASLAHSRSVADLAMMLSAGGHTPSRSAAGHEAVRAVQQAIDDLPENYRRAVQMRLLEGKSLEETAAELNCGPRAVQGLVDRAKKKMRAALGRLSLYE